MMILEHLPGIKVRYITTGRVVSTAKENRGTDKVVGYYLQYKKQKSEIFIFGNTFLALLTHYCHITIFYPSVHFQIFHPYSSTYVIIQTKLWPLLLTQSLPSINIIINNNTITKMTSPFTTIIAIDHNHIFILTTIINTII